MNLTVDHPVWPALKRVHPTLSKGEINKAVNSLISVIQKQYPEGNPSMYSIAGTEMVNINRPMISYNKENNQWEIIAFNKLIEPNLNY